MVLRVCGRFLFSLVLLAGVASAAADVVTWTAADGGDWSEPDNWDLGRLPGAGDEVVVVLAESAALVHAGGDTRVRGLSVQGHLRLAGGTVTVTGAASLSGRLTLASGAALVAEGGDAELIIRSGLALNGGELIARGGARLALPELSQQSGDGLIRADGAGSRVDLEALSNIGILPTEVPDLTEAVSRQATVYRGPADSADVLTDLTEAVSRQATVYRGPADSADVLTDLTEAVSRQATVYRGPADSADVLTDLTEAVSRQATVYRGPADSADVLTDLTEAVSRQASVYRGPADSADLLSDLTESVSREASVYRSLGPVAYWRFEAGPEDAPAQGDGAIAGESEAVPGGTAYGDPTYRGDVPLAVIPQTGATNSFSLDLDGDDHVRIPRFSTPRLGDAFTIELWLKSDAAHADDFLIADESHGFTDSSGWFIQGRSSGEIAFGVGNGGGGAGNFAEVAAEQRILDGQWHHLAGVYDAAAVGAELKLYQDGVLVAYGNSPAYVGNTRDIHVGAAWGGGTPSRFFTGKLDELRISARALTPAEFLSATPMAASCLPQLRAPSVPPFATPGDPMQAIRAHPALLPLDQVQPVGVDRRSASIAQPGSITSRCAPLLPCNGMTAWILPHALSRKRCRHPQPPDLEPSGPRPFRTTPFRISGQRSAT